MAGPRNRHGKTYKCIQILVGKPEWESYLEYQGIVLCRNQTDNVAG
jgi:hypothetical protein